VLLHTFRFFRAVDRSYALAVLWLYVGLFLFTFALIFVFPPGALVMVFVGLAGLLLAVILGRVLRLIHLGLGRLLMRRLSRR
jgi:hypothetical protein